jgi:general secretion pathway protein J
MRRVAARQDGFTLLELLIALVILAMMAAIGLEAFRLGSRSWERGERRAASEQRVRAIQGTLTRDLGTLLPINVLEEGERVMDFVGRPDRMTFHSAPVPYRPLPYGAMVRRISYFVEPGTGLVVQEGYPLAERPPVSHPLDRAVVRIGFRYLVPPGLGESAWRWIGAWKPRQLGGPSGRELQLQGRVDASISTGDLPLAVEITLHLDDEGRTHELNLLVPVHVGRYL